MTKPTRWLLFWPGLVTTLVSGYYTLDIIGPPPIEMVLGGAFAAGVLMLICAWDFL